MKIISKLSPINRLLYWKKYLGMGVSGGREYTYSSHPPKHSRSNYFNSCVQFYASGLLNHKFPTLVQNLVIFGGIGALVIFSISTHHIWQYRKLKNREKLLALELFNWNQELSFIQSQLESH